MEHFVGMTQSLMSTRSRNANPSTAMRTSIIEANWSFSAVRFVESNRFWGSGGCRVNRAGFSCDQNRRIAATP